MTKLKSESSSSRRANKNWLPISLACCFNVWCHCTNPHWPLNFYFFLKSWIKKVEFILYNYSSYESTVSGVLPLEFCQQIWLLPSWISVSEHQRRSIWILLEDVIQHFSHFKNFCFGELLLTTQFKAEVLPVFKGSS